MTVAQEFAARLAQERRIKAAREERDIPNGEIAAAVGTSGANVSKWLAGAALPRDDALRALAEYFGVRIAWLRYGEGARAAGLTGMHDTATGAPRMEQHQLHSEPAPRKKRQGGR